MNTPGENIRESGRYVRHVPIVAWLLIVNGILLLLGTLFFGGMSVFFQFMPNQGPVDESFKNWMTMVYGGIALISFFAAVIQIFAGIRNLDFRNRTLGLTALVVGLLALFTGFCALNSIGLAVYGLIIYLNAEAAEAFRLRRTGLSKEEVYSEMHV